MAQTIYAHMNKWIKKGETTEKYLSKKKKMLWKASSVALATATLVCFDGVPFREWVLVQATCRIQVTWKSWEFSVMPGLVCFFTFIPTAVMHGGSTCTKAWLGVMGMDQWARQTSKPCIHWAAKAYGDTGKKQINRLISIFQWRQ
jgi:hypothetical protein